MLQWPFLGWGQDQKPINIGLVGPLTGANALNGQLMKEGAETAVLYINSKRGIHGRALKLIIEDDAGDPKQALVAANNLVGRSPDISFVIGHATSATTLPAAPIYIENKTILLAPVNADSLTTNPSPYVFRIIPPNSSYAKHVANEIIASGKTNIAIIHNQTEYGRGFADLLKEHLNQRGIHEKLFEGFMAGENDYRALISKFENAAINAVVLALYPHEAALVIRQAAELGFIVGKKDKPSWFGHSLLVTREFYEVAGDAANGAKIVSVAGCDSLNLQSELSHEKSTREVLTFFNRQGIAKVDVTHTIIFSAFEIASQALANPSAVGVSTLSEILYANEFKTICGPLCFSRSGELREPDRSLALYEIGPNGPHLVKRYERSVRL